MVSRLDMKSSNLMEHSTRVHCKYVILISYYNYKHHLVVTGASSAGPRKTCCQNVTVTLSAISCVLFVWYGKYGGGNVNIAHSATGKYQPCHSCIYSHGVYLIYWRHTGDCPELVHPIPLACPRSAFCGLPMFVSA